MAGRGASRGGGAAQAEGGLAALGCGAVFSRTGQLWVYDSKPGGVGGGVPGSSGNMVKVYSVASSPVISKNLAQRCVRPAHQRPTPRTQNPSSQDPSPRNINSHSLQTPNLAMSIHLPSKPRISQCQFTFPPNPESRNINSPSLQTPNLAMSIHLPSKPRITQYQFTFPPNPESRNINSPSLQTPNPAISIHLPSKPRISRIFQLYAGTRHGLQAVTWDQHAAQTHN
jgi:hypothetical protein